METRRIPVHITNLYPETLQIKDLRATDRNSMFTLWTFTTAGRPDVHFPKLISAAQRGRVAFVVQQGC